MQHPSTHSSAAASDVPATLNEPLPIKPSSKSKSKAIPGVVPLERTTSDIENQPEVVAVDKPANMTEAVGPATAPVALQTLSLYSYKQYRPAPAVVYTRHEEEANDLVHSLKGPIGFDLEWVVTFRRGRAPMERRTALVQLCDSRMILLVQVSAMSKFPQKVKELIENKKVVKMGANIRNDGQKLFRDFGLLSANLVELGGLARQADPTFSQTFNRSIVALAKVVERYTGKTLDKGKVRTSNWEAQLSQSQITYAANDAHCALMVYNNLLAIAKAHEREINWDECSSDLEKVYRAKTATNTPAPAPALPAIPQEEEEEEDAEAATLGANPTAIMATGASSYVQDLPSSSAVPASTGGPSASTSSANSSVVPGAPPRPQHLRAYNMWHHRDMPLHDICAALRSKENPLKESTVISYVVGALQADPRLPFSTDRLKAFVQLEAGSWRRHRDWILEKDGYQ
ncbi:ribonuclease H-like domain-containing protein [Daedaleopsis nitida]|nr:ribonuclease H-like domain-containing protein [Daedaleopsis nitida]